MTVIHDVERRSPYNLRLLRIDQLQSFVPFVPGCDTKCGLSNSDFAAELDAHSIQTEKRCSLFVVLDAASLVNLPELLDVSGLPHRCLIQGEAEKELYTVAPWLVELSPDAGFTQKLMTLSKAPWDLWGRHNGLFLQSAQDITGVSRHLRRFLKVQKDDGRWLYVRFWERIFLDAIQDALEAGHTCIARFFMGSSAELDVCLLNQDLTRRLSVMPQTKADRTAIMRTPFGKVVEILRPYLKARKLEYDLQRIAKSMSPLGFGPVDDLAELLRFYFKKGFTNMNQLEEIALVEIKFDMQFSLDPYVHDLLKNGNCGYSEFLWLMKRAEERAI